jgi:outer membrane protein OmpA-like peptidoglycan-associated protein
MSDPSMSKVKMLVVGFVWLSILGVCVVGYRWIFVPQLEKIAEQEAIQEKEELLNHTSCNARYTENMTINIDSFSGYLIARSNEFRNELGSYGYGLVLKDDKADYLQRLKDIQSGQSQFAFFTIDALIKASHQLGEMPGTIIFVVDESVGADAAIGVERMVSNVDTLNDLETKFVIVPDSPNETLARVIMSYFDLDKLGADPFVKVDSAKEMYEMYRRHKPTDKKIFVTWEPYVSKMAENPDYKVLVDSGKFRGFIVDVMVVSRDFLAKNPRQVRNVTEAYFRTLFKHQKDMVAALMDDSVSIGEPLKVELATSLADKIRWKNTRENYAKFGITKGTGLQHIEDSIINITRVLRETGGIDSDPTSGRPNQLYYDQILLEMSQSNFHPGTVGDSESIRDDSELVALSDDDWKRLEPVGTLQVPNLVFARSASRLSESSKHTLEELANKLKDAPQFYLLVTGNAGTVGDLEANTNLAMARAESAKEYLITQGISPQRIRAVGGEPSGQTIVTFVVGQLPY